MSLDVKGGGVENWLEKKAITVIEGRGKSSQGFYGKSMCMNLFLSYICLSNKT